MFGEKLADDATEHLDAERARQAKLGNIGEGEELPLFSQARLDAMRVAQPKYDDYASVEAYLKECRIALIDKGDDYKELLEVWRFNKGEVTHHNRAMIGCALGAAAVGSLSLGILYTSYNFLLTAIGSIMAMGSAAALSPLAPIVGLAVGVLVLYGAYKMSEQAKQAGKMQKHHQMLTQKTEAAIHDTGNVYASALTGEAPLTIRFAQARAIQVDGKRQVNDAASALQIFYPDRFLASEETGGARFKAATEERFERHEPDRRLVLALTRLLHVKMPILPQAAAA